MHNSLVQQAVWVLCGRSIGGGPERKVRIETTPFTIGRRPGNSLTLECPSVSSNHAQFTACDGGLSIEDLGSTNGTFVNGERVTAPRELQLGDLVQIASTVFRVTNEEDRFDPSTIASDSADQAIALIQFDRLVSDPAVTPYFQAIVPLGRAEATARFEVLARSELSRLRTPKQMFESASTLGMEAHLSRVLRMEGVRCATAIPGRPKIFLNTHPAELAEPRRLVDSLEEIRAFATQMPLVLEIHEACVTQIEHMQYLRGAAADLRIELAYDDFGAGQARLVELVEAPPEYLKVDIGLIHGVHQATSERKGMLASLVKMAGELGIATIAEGVEVQEEHDACAELGFDYAQGYLHGKPAPAEALPGATLPPARPDSTL